MDRFMGARARRVLVVLLVGLLAVALAAPFLPSAAAASTDDEPPAVGAADAEGAVVLVGVTGLQWGDVRTLATPNLWALSRQAGVGTLAARSAHGTACPADGWLAVSAGARLADVETDDGACRTLRDVFDEGDVVPGWADYVTAAGSQPYGAAPGLLGDLLTAADVPVTGIGPGAAVALAAESGVPVGTHVPWPADGTGLTRAVRDALEESRLVVVDAGQVRETGHATTLRTPAPAEPTPSATPEGAEEPEAPGLPGTEAESSGPDVVDTIVEPTRQEQVRELDGRIGDVLRATRGDDVTVYVLSLADAGRPRLQLAAATGTAPDGSAYEGQLLTTGTTRQPALVQATDVTATLLAGLGVPVPDAAVGAPIVPVAGPESATARITLVEDIAAEALQVTRVSGSFLTRLVLAEAVLFLAAAALLTRGGRSDRAPLRPALHALRVGALALGAMPIASFLTGLVPWWRAGSPVDAFWWVLLGWTAVITAVALLGPWRRRLLGPAGVVAGITVVTLVVDALVGSPLVIDSPMGAHRLQAARFYGMSNQAFALLAAAGPVLAAVVAHPLLVAGRRRLAVAAVVVVGLVVTVVDGAPGLGSDFGGPPALIVAFAVLAIAVSGRRVRWRTLLLVVVVGAVVVVGFAVLDWMREPADRTHLGRFWATVIDGGLWDVVLRKLSVHLRVLTYWRYVVLAVGGAFVTWLVLVGPKRGRGLLGDRSPMLGMREAVPLLRPTVAAVGIALGIGFLINDSGIIIPATGMAFAVPCLLAGAAQRRLEDPEDTAAAEERRAALAEGASAEASADASAEGASGSATPTRD